MGLIMLQLRPTSLLYVSLFGLLDAAVQVVFGAAVGAYVDRYDEGKKRKKPLAQETCVRLDTSICRSFLFWRSNRRGLKQVT